MIVPSIRRCVALCVLLLAGIPSATAQELGRLFFSAEQRQTLNQKRALPAPQPAQESPPKLEPAANLEATESVPLPPPQVTGRVTRSSGNNTVWINNHPQYKRGKQ